MMASVDTHSIGTSTTGSVRSYSPEDDTLSTIEEAVFAVNTAPLTSTPCKLQESGLTFDDKHRGKNAKVLRMGTLAQRRKK